MIRMARGSTRAQIGLADGISSEEGGIRARGQEHCRMSGQHEQDRDHAGPLSPGES